MIVTVKREVPIGHRLHKYKGRCQFFHGHNYVFEISVEGQPNGLGLVVDFRDLKKSLDKLLDLFDHAMILHEDDPYVQQLRSTGERLVVLNCNPSAENLAQVVFNEMKRSFHVSSVMVRETEDGWAVATKIDMNVRIIG